MAIDLTCTHCGEMYRVRDAAAGKSFDCKICGTTLQIPKDDQGPGRSSLSAERRRARQAQRTRQFEEDFQEEDEERPKPRKRRSAGEHATLWPALGLYFVGGIWLAIYLGAMVKAMGNPAFGQMPPGMTEARQFGYRAGYYFGVCGMPLTSIVVLVGAYCLHTRQAYPIAVTGCILASIPCCSPFLIVGIPFGVWGLIALSDENVKQSFL